MIPISRPTLGDEEVAAVKDVILSGWVTQGPKVQEFENAFADYVGARHACAVSSCTSALHLALLVIGVKPGDIVITVSHSFIATANAVRYCGAEPVFLDIDPATFNMSVDHLERFFNEACERSDGQLYYKDIDRLIGGESPLIYFGENHVRGRIAAVLPVHQMGIPCEIGKITDLAKRFGIPIVEDAACAIGSEISPDNGRTWERIGKPHGEIACFSFHPRKVLTTGDGGMLTTNNAAYDTQFRLLRQHGMSVSDVARHHSKKVVFENYQMTGFNYRMTDIQAAVGVEQLKKLPRLIESRRAIDGLYRRYLSDNSWLKLMAESTNHKFNWQSYMITILDVAPLSRDTLIQYLLDNGVACKPGIMNSHTEDPYRDNHHALPNSEKARDQVILIPIYTDLTEVDIKKIATLLNQVQNSQ